MHATSSAWPLKVSTQLIQNHSFIKFELYAKRLYVRNLRTNSPPLAYPISPYPWLYSLYPLPSTHSPNSYHTHHYTHHLYPHPTNHHFPTYIPTKLITIPSVYPTSTCLPPSTYSLLHIHHFPILHYSFPIHFP